MRKILLLIALCAATGAMMAQDVPVQKLVVWMRSGEKIYFALEDEPVTTFEPGKLILQTSKDAPIIYLLENVIKYTYEGGSGMDIGSPKVAPGTILVSQNNEMVIIEGLPDRTNVSVYTVDGKLLFGKQAIEGQPTTILMTACPAGEYIVKAGGTSIKFVKQ